MWSSALLNLQFSRLHWKLTNPRSSLTGMVSLFFEILRLRLRKTFAHAKSLYCGGVLPSMLAEHVALQIPCPRNCLLIPKHPVAAPKQRSLCALVTCRTPHMVLDVLC